MEETGIDLRHLIGILRRQAHLILSTVAVVVAIAFVVIFAITPLYTGKNLILVDPSQKNLLDPTEQAGANASTDSARVDSEVELVDSDAVLLEVINKGYTGGPDNLISDSEFGVKLGMKDKVLAFLRIQDATLPGGEEALGQVLENLRKAISVQRQGLTYLIAVEVRSEDPKRAAALANAISETYIRNQIQMKVAGAVAASDIVKLQIEQAEAAVVSAEADFNDYLVNNIDTFVSETGRVDFGAMRDELTAIGREKAATEAQLAKLDLNLQAGNYGALATSLQNDAIKELQRQRQELESRLTPASVAAGQDVELRKQLADLNKQLEARAREEVGSMHSMLSDFDKQGTDIRSKLSKEILASDLPTNILAQIYRLQQVSRNATDQYQALLARNQTLETEAALQVADSRIVSPAFTPTRSSYPNTKLILAGSFILALGAGVGFAFLFENFIGGFTNQDQVEAILRVPVATVVPKQTLVGPNSLSVSDSIIDSPLSMFAESLRRMRVVIDQSVAKSRANVTDGKNARGKVIMISSALPGEGKSTIALSIARTLALSGYKTIIFDCDLRRPSVHKHLNLEPSSGLADYLKGDLSHADLMDIVKTDERSGLTTVVGARRSDIPTDQLLDRGSFARMISNALGRFDYIVLDSPPIEPVVDGLYLAKYADVIAFVIRWATTPQHLCRQAIEKLEDAKLPNVQIVALLNQQEGKRAGYYSSYSDYYSE